VAPEKCDSREWGVVRLSLSAARVFGAGQMPFDDRELEEEDPEEGTDRSKRSFESP